MAVRDPMLRLLSTYRDVSIHWKNFLKEYAQKLRKKKKNVNHATWPEFLHFLTHGGENDNNHWGRFYEVCHPCAVDYDFILHHENIVEEGNYFLRYINAPQFLTFPNSSRFKTYTDEEVLEENMKGIPQSIINKLYEIYSIDYKLFGYNKAF